MGLRGKDSGTLVGTRTVVCVWVSGQGLEAVAEEGSRSRAILVPRPQRLLRTERLSVRSVQLPLTPRASTCTPSGGHGRRGVPPGPTPVHATPLHRCPELQVWSALDGRTLQSRVSMGHKDPSSADTAGEGCML